MTVVSEQEPAELPERWSAKAKIEVVLRLLRGESVEAVSRYRYSNTLNPWLPKLFSSFGDFLRDLI